MGCGACIGDKMVSAPIGYGTALETTLFWNVKKSLKPCQLIPQDKFSQIIKQLQFSAFASARKNKIANNQQEQQNLMVLTQQQKLRLKWKLLIFCHDYDMYEPQQYNTILLGLNHSCFPQIQKDIQRTFPQQKFFQSPEGVIIFQRLLKRIALFFPSVGYTQGINFIVGYLLVLDFTEEETFWIIVHLAMSPRFMMLGFFQDGFPMSSIYCKFLNYIFQTNLPDLFNHFEQLGVPPQAWVFKWFMTYYLYSFPKSIARDIWSLIMLRGGLGMVYFAFSLLKQLQKTLFQFSESTEIIGFFQNFRDLSIFNSFVNSKSLLQRAYSIEITPEEIETVTKQYIQQSSINNFYLHYFSLSQQSQKQTQLIKNWHLKLRKERINFRTTKNIVQKQIKRQSDKDLLNPTIIPLKKNPNRQGRFRIKEEQFRKTKQKLFLQKSMKASSVIEELSQENKSIMNRSKFSSRNSKVSNLIQVSSISNNLQISNNSSKIQFSKVPSQQSLYIQETSSRHGELTDQQISEGEKTSRHNISVHIRKQPITANNSNNQKQEQIQIFDFQPFKKKKEKTAISGLTQRSPSTKLQLHFPSNMNNLKHKQSQKTIIQIGPNNVIMRQQTIYSVDPSERQIIDIDFEGSNNLHCQSLDFRYRTPQIIKVHKQSKSNENQ